MYITIFIQNSSVVQSLATFALKSYLPECHVNQQCGTSFRLKGFPISEGGRKQGDGSFLHCLTSIHVSLQYQSCSCCQPDYETGRAEVGQFTASISDIQFPQYFPFIIPDNGLPFPIYSSSRPLFVSSPLCTYNHGAFSTLLSLAFHPNTGPPLLLSQPPTTKVCNVPQCTAFLTFATSMALRFLLDTFITPSLITFPSPKPDGLMGQQPLQCRQMCLLSQKYICKTAVINKDAGYNISK